MSELEPAVRNRGGNLLVGPQGDQPARLPAFLDEAQRPGAVAAALPPSSTATPEPTPFWDVPVHWSLSDVIDCISREVQRRETQYPIQMQQSLLSAERAQQELGQMKAALQILTSMQDRGQDARQGTLF